MAPEDDRQLERRLDRLEGLVEELLRRMPSSDAASISASFSAPAAAPREPSPFWAASMDAAPRPEDAAPGPSHVSGPLRTPSRADGGEGEPVRPPRARARPRFDGQLWLNRIGIALLLISMAMLFRYSIDRGWLTPLVRVAFGAATGLAMLGAGFWLDVRRQRFVSMMYGGGMAVFYIVGFAAFYVYELVGYVPAFAAMCVVTLLTFALALWKDEQALAVLAALGGLGIPLVLGIDHGQPHAFAVYTCFILAWTALLYLRRGWRTLHWLATMGGWGLLVAYATFFHGGAADVVARWALQGAAVFAWLATALAPVAQEVARGFDPAAVPPPSVATTAGDDDEDEDEVYAGGWRDVDVLHWHGAALLPALAALGITSLTWSPSLHAWGVIALGAAGLYGAASLLVRERHEPMSVVLSLAGSVLLAVGTVASFDGDALLLILAGEGLALQVLAHRSGSTALSTAAHCLYSAAAWWMVGRLVGSSARQPTEAAANLAVIGAGLAISFVVVHRPIVVAYRVFVHLAFLGWLWSVLWPFSEGFVTISWSLYGLAMLLHAMRNRRERLERLAIGTLMLAVAKLFLVDLARVDALWRVLLFMGLGVVFLTLSYALQGRFRAGDEAAPPGPDRG
jgi:uncharacterized membrane protein